MATVDVITPIIDDPYLFGQIAAANSLSDIFAMGGKALYALNVCSFPKEMDLRDADLIIEGALAKLKEIEVPIAGGHTISEPSLLFGLSVTGLIADQKYFANDMAKENQTLILTKPFGIGVCYAANNANLLSEAEYQQWIDTMTRLNYQASVIAKKYVTTMSDVTGFGLLGHSLEIAKASQVSFTINFEMIKFLPNVVEYAKQGYLTGASYTNYEALKTDINSSRDQVIDLLLCDPQTSGGLLLVVAKDKQEALLKELQENNINAFVIGETTKLKDKYLQIK